MKYSQLEGDDVPDCSGDLTWDESQTSCLSYGYDERCGVDQTDGKESSSKSEESHDEKVRGIDFEKRRLGDDLNTRLWHRTVSVRQCILTRITYPARDERSK